MLSMIKVRASAGFLSLLLFLCAVLPLNMQTVSAATGDAIIVDNGNPGYYESTAGSWTDSNLKGYQNSGTRFTNNASALGPYVLYIPSLPADGNYKVSIYRIVEASSDPHARIDVAHSEGTDTQYMDESTGTSGWMELGTYHFTSGSNGYVKLSLDTLNRRLRADAVKFELVKEDEAQTFHLYPSADTYVNGGASAGTNFGSAAELLVKKDAEMYTRQTYMKFDAGAYAGTVGQAVLYFYGAVTDPAGTEVDLSLYSTNDAGWLEKELNWNSVRPKSYDYIGKVRVQSANQEYKWYGVDVTSYVRAKTEEGLPLQFTLLQEGDKGLLVRLKSKESLTYKPYIRISPDRPGQSGPYWPPMSRLAADNGSAETTAALNWTAAQTDGLPIDGYKIYKNGAYLDTVSASTYQYAAAGLAMDTQYTFKVEAVNAGEAESRDGPFITLRTAKIGLEQMKLGNVFLNSEAVRFKLATNRQTISWKVKDAWDRTVTEGVYTNSGTEAILTVPMDRNGYFLLEATLESPGRVPVGLRTPFAVSSEYDWSAVDASPFGFNTHFASSATGWSPELSSLARDAGASDIRDGFYWATVETQAGQYDFSKYTPYMAQIGEDGIQPLIMLGLENPLYDGGSTPYSQAGYQAYAAYAAASVARFGSQVKMVEIYNEFNIPGYGDRGNGPADSKPEVYFQLLKTSYETIKAARPDVTVAGLASAGVPLDWIEEVFKLGGLQYMDVISIHPYQYPRSPEAMQNELNGLKELILRYNNGQMKPIWSTEIGWPTNEGSTNEKTQADYLVRTYVFSVANGIDKVYWYDFMNDGIDKTYNENNFGVIRNRNDLLGAYTPKPAYAAFAAMTRQLTGWQYDHADDFGTSISSYSFTQDSDEVRVVWAQREMTAAIDAAGPLQVTDLMGNSETYVPYQGKVYLSLSGEPKYIKGPVLAIQEDGTYSLKGGQTLAGDPAKLTLEVHNASAADIEASVSMAGMDYPLFAAAGQSLDMTLVHPPIQELGKQRLSGYLSAGGQLFGRLDVQLQVTDSGRITLWPVMDGTTGEKALRLTLTNLSESLPMEIGRIDWEFNGQTGADDGGFTLQPSSTQTYDIPVDGDLERGTSYASKVKVELPGKSPYTYAGNLDFNLIPYGSVTVDGIMDASQEPFTAELAKGTVNMSGYGGEQDLSGSIRLAWDEQNLYVTAQLTDDVLAYSSSGADIYKNDSIQFAIADDLPGLSKEWYEYGLSLTPGGPQIYRWLAPAGLPDGDATGRGSLKIERDEAGAQTVYELALPWSEIPTISRESGAGITFSLLVNDNDGSGRKGFIEWGSGIGTDKSQAKFKTLQWGER